MRGNGYLWQMYDDDGVDVDGDDVDDDDDSAVSI